MAAPCAAVAVTAVQWGLKLAGLVLDVEDHTNELGRQQGSAAMSGRGSIQ